VFAPSRTSAGLRAVERIKGSPLLLAYERTRTGHDDVVLSLGDYVHRCDSYYFGVEASAGLYPHHLAVMIRMLDQWRECLERLAEGDRCFLPFDFSDQCTAWLRCERLAGGEVRIRAGWSSIEGWSCLPSDFSAHAGDVPDWRAIENSAAITTPRSALLTQIAASQAALRSQASTLESGIRAGDRRTKR